MRMSIVKYTFRAMSHMSLQMPHHYHRLDGTRVGGCRKMNKRRRGKRMNTECNEDKWIFQCFLNASAKGHMFSRDPRTSARSNTNTLNAGSQV